MRRCIYCPIQKTREKHWVGLFQYKSFRFIIWHMSWKRNECLWAPCRVCSLYAGSCRRPQHGLLGREKNRNKKRSHSSINDILRTTCKSRTPSCTVCCSCGTSHRWPAACAHANRKQPPSPFTFNSVNPDRSILYLPLHHHPSRPPHPHQGSLLSALPSGSPWASAFPSTTPVRPPVPFELHRQPFILGAFVDRSRFQGPNQLS